MLFSQSPTPPVELAVVGEHKDDPEELLLLGKDGNYYAYSTATEAILPVEPDEQWDVQTDAPGELFEQLS